jgi:hypothetical protein
LLEKKYYVRWTGWDEAEQSRDSGSQLHMQQQMQQVQGKGIIRRARGFSLFGIRAFWFGLVWYCWKERRVYEAAVSAVELVVLSLHRVPVPHRLTNVRQFTQRFIRFHISGSPELVAREQAVCAIDGGVIACEYGQPGKRVLFRCAEGDSISNFYQEDDRVWHLHAATSVNDHQVLISTGDSRKCLDQLTLSRGRLPSFRRLRRRMAGFTAMARIGTTVWCGSDFSERANYLLNLETQRKHYLPHAAVREFIIHIEACSEGLLVVTRRLHHPFGHALVFSIRDGRFAACNRIDVLEALVEDYELDLGPRPALGRLR